MSRDGGGRAVDTTAEGIAEVVTKAHDIWPELDPSNAIARFAGLRATPANGDFTIGESAEVPCFFNASGIESPGLTAAPAIAVDLAAQVAEIAEGISTTEAAIVEAVRGGMKLADARAKFGYHTLQTKVE